jgi:hypothetical protein
MLAHEMKSITIHIGIAGHVYGAKAHGQRHACVSVFE